MRGLWTGIRDLGLAASYKHTTFPCPSPELGAGILRWAPSWGMGNLLGDVCCMSLYPAGVLGWGYLDGNKEGLGEGRGKGIKNEGT